MRGPSSSHTAASWRVANIAVQMLSDDLSEAHIVFDKDGQWATNYEEQGTVLGMNGGLLGIDMTDDQMKIHKEIAQQRGVNIIYSIGSFENNHPNSMLLKLVGSGGAHTEILAVSLGGGSFEIRKIDGFRVTLKGDTHCLVVWADNKVLFEKLQGLTRDTINISQLSGPDNYLHIVQSAIAIDDSTLSMLREMKGVTKVARIYPVMPILSGKERELPFSNIDTLTSFCKKENLSLGEAGLIYEQYRSGLSKSELYNKMDHIVCIIEESIATGLKGTEYKDRILPQQSHLIDKAEKAGKILNGSIVNTIIKNVAAIMESKSALEVVVANPTAGSCGCPSNGRRG